MDKDFEIATYENSREAIMKFREQGALRGVFLGFPEFHENYTMSLPGITDWTGVPQSGKSEFVLELLLNTSLFYGWKHLLYVPDIGKREITISKLVHKITGKTFDKRYVNSNYISETEIDAQLHWVLEHFLIVIRKNPRKKLTPYEFWDWAVEIKKTQGLHTATIDSWKDMKRYVGRDGQPITRDDLYLEDVLEYRNALSEEHNLHFHTIIHPIRTEMENGKRVVPTAYHLKGGPTWNDSGKNIITVDRVDGTFNQTDVYIFKGKPETVAKQGKHTFFYDAKRSRYYTKGIDGNIYASQKYIKPIGIKIQEEIQEQEEDDNDDIPF